MRPVRLELSGFTCFREPQSIGFEDLELFAIQGQTGAGKSSILDAITYALYGQTARLGSRGLEALVSQGASGMFVTLEFEVSPGERYRVSRVWSVKQSERQVRFERRVGEGWVTAVEGVKVKDVGVAIQRVVGLDFDGFTRAVLLPQGEFDRFLRGDASDRRELLKGLLSLHHYEQMRERASEIARELKAQIETRNVLLNGEYAEATADALEALRTELEAVQSRVTALQSRRTDELVRLDGMRELARLVLQLEGVRVRLAGLEARAAEVARMRERASLARRVAAVMPRLEVKERAEKGLQTVQVAYQRASKAFEVALETENATRARLQDALEASRELPLLEEQLDAVREATPKMDRLRALGGTLDTTHPDPSAFSEARAAELERLRASLNIWTRSRTQLRELEKTVQDTEKRIEALGAEVIELAEQLEHCIQEGKDAKLKAERLEQELEVARRENLVGQLAHDLKLGDPCPVCGEPLTRLPDVSENRVPGLEAQRRTASERRLKLQGDYKGLQAQLEAGNKALETARTEREKLEAQHKLIKREVIELRESFEAALGEFDDPNAALETARTRLLAGLALEVRDVTNGQNPDALVKKLSAQRKTLQQSEREAREAADAARLSSSEARSASETAKTQLEARREELLEREQECKKALAEAGIDDAEAAREAALPETEMARLEAQVREHADALGSAKGDETRLVLEVAGRTFDADALRTLEASVAALEHELRESDRLHGQLDHRLRDLERRIEQAKILRREVAEMGKQYDVYAQLALDLKGNEFQEFMLAQVQQELLGRASTIMREVTRERYQLALRDGEYHVLDNWNGMEARGVKTLSGGESFIASLSLALALSDYLAGHRALGALFLDEGFGTLDAEALDAVASVLETIQTQGRMVGVITHVSNLAERLPYRLVVEKGTASSRVRWDS
jgi:exonuclease SbcC